MSKYDLSIIGFRPHFPSPGGREVGHNLIGCVINSLGEFSEGANRSVEQ